MDCWCIDAAEGVARLIRRWGKGCGGACILPMGVPDIWPGPTAVRGDSEAPRPSPPLTLPIRGDPAYD